MEQSYFKARNTLIDMMIDRGYSTIDEIEGGLNSYHLSITEFNPLYESDKMDITGIKTRDNFPVYIRFFKSETEIKGQGNLFKVEANKQDLNPLYPVANYFGVEIK